MLLCVGAVQFVNILDFMVVMPMGPDLATTLGIAPSHLGVVGGSYTAAAAVAGLAGSTFLDRFDRRSALVVAMLGLAVGTLLGGFATSLPSLVAARIVAGAFGGPATALSLSIVADVVPPERRGKAMGAIMGAFSLASVLGVPLGLELARRFSFRAPFFFIAVLGLAITLAARTLLPPLRGHLDRGPRAPLLHTFRRLFENPTVLLAYALTALGAVGMFSLVPNIASYLQFNQHYPRDRLGVLYLVGGSLSFFVTRSSGPLVDKVGATTLIAIGTLIFGVDVFAGFILPHPPVPIMIIFVVFMATTGLRNVAISTLVSKVPKPEERAGFMSLQTAVQHFACAVGAFGASQLLGEEVGTHRLIGMPSVAIGCLVAVFSLVPLAWVVERRIRDGLQAASLRPPPPTRLEPLGRTEGESGRRGRELLLQERQHRGLFWRQIVQLVPQHGFGPMAERLHELPVQVGLDDEWVHVAFPTDRRRIAQPPGHLLDGCDHVPLRLRRAAEGLERTQRLCRQHRPCPRSKVLGGKISAGHVAQEAIHVGRLDGVRLPVGVQVVKQLVSGQILTSRHDAREALVGNVDGVLLAALAAEMKVNARALDDHVLFAHGRQAERRVRPRVLLVPHPDERDFEEAHHRREHLLSRETGPPQLFVAALPQRGQGAGEGQDSFVLGVVPDLAPARMVAVLLASSLVSPGCLDVAVRHGADPDVRPGGRDDERPDPGEHVGITDGLALAVQVAERLAPGLAGQARLMVADVAEPGLLGGGRAFGWCSWINASGPCSLGAAGLFSGTPRRGDGDGSSHHREALCTGRTAAGHGMADVAEGKGNRTLSRRFHASHRF